MAAIPGCASVTAAFALSAFTAQAAEPIEGNWKTASGATAQIAPCGGSFCVTLKSGHNLMAEMPAGVLDAMLAGLRGG